MPELLLTLILHAWLLSAAAVCFATVLVSDGMLLAPVQAWVRSKYRKVTAPYGSKGNPYAGREIDEQWWWKPLWGCSLCVSGQMAFWLYFYLSWGHYQPLHHLYFTSLTILFAAGWRAFYAWTQKL